MTDLTAKFTALEGQLTTQHNAVTGKLDAILAALGTINTTLTSNGAFDAAPIVDAIVALRGAGPENTLKSVNQSVWNLAGTSPGASLLDLKTAISALDDAIVALRGAGPDNTVRSINQSIWNLAGTAPGASLLDLQSAIVALRGTAPGASLLDLQSAIVALRGSGPGASLLDLKTAISALGNGKSLSDLYGQWSGGAGLSAYNLLDTMYLVMARLLNQFDTSVVVPTMKDLLMHVSENTDVIAACTNDPVDVVPPDLCNSPLTSTGRFFLDTSLLMVDPVTVATWPAFPGGDFTATFEPSMAAYPKLHCINDWTTHHIYVASKSDTFGVSLGRGERFPCNKWLTLSIPEDGLIEMTGAMFNVDRANDLTVYICPWSTTPVNPDPDPDPDPNPNTTQNPDPGSCTSATDHYSGRATAYSVIDTFQDNGIAYNVYAPVMPTVSGLLINYDAANGIARLDPNFKNTYPNGWVVVCVSWDFTGNNVWPFYWRALGDIGSASFGIGKPITSMNIVGSRMTEMFSTPISGSQEYMAMEFAAPADLGMPANVFIHVRAVSSVGHPLLP